MTRNRYLVIMKEKVVCYNEDDYISWNITIRPHYFNSVKDGLDFIEDVCSSSDGEINYKVVWSGPVEVKSYIPHYEASPLDFEKEYENGNPYTDVKVCKCPICKHTKDEV